MDTYVLSSCLVYMYMIYICVYNMLLFLVITFKINKIQIIFFK